ncbi:protein eyes shut homolog [Pogona vitticeps]
MSSTTPALAHARLKLRSLQSWFLALFDPMVDSQRKRLRVTPELVRQLQWWTDPENWFCECPAFYSGKLCQFSTCEETPCGNGATCVPKSSQDAVCLCPYGRAGLLCDDVVNITYPSYSGTDAFGYTSFLAYSAIPNISLYYEFHLKFRLANHDSSVEDNLIFFTGQKGQGLNGDDFLVLGLRNGSVVYTYNLGSGTATIISEPLDLTHPIHVVSLGRSLQEGWMKVIITSERPHGQLCFII